MQTCAHGGKPMVGKDPTCAHGGKPVVGKDPMAQLYNQAGKR